MGFKLLRIPIPLLINSLSIFSHQSTHRVSEREYLLAERVVGLALPDSVRAAVAVGMAWKERERERMRKVGMI